MNKEEIKQQLLDLYSKLDDLQEIPLVQGNENLMWEIGEAMGSVDNALDILEAK